MEEQANRISTQGFQKEKEEEEGTEKGGTGGTEHVTPISQSYQSLGLRSTHTPEKWLC